MKKNTLRLTSLLLTLCLLLSLAACGGSPAASTEAPAEQTTEAPTEQTAAPTEGTTEAPTEQTTEPAAPVRGMNALREKAVAYMKAMAAVEWTPGTNTAGAPYWSNYKYGTVYHGLPYTNIWDSSLEEFTAYVKDGVYTGPVGEATAIGVDCTSSTLAAWATVITDCSAVWTAQMMPRRYGTVPVGEYVAKALMSDTTAIVQGNDEQVMYRSYAQVLPGDAILRYKNSEGHCRMITKEPTVVTLPDGSIDGSKSFVYITEIGYAGKDAQGYPTMWNVDKAYSFKDLIGTNYVPISTPELDAGVAAPLEIEVTETPDPSRLLTEGLSGKISCNYRIFEVTVTVTDGSGREVVRVTDYPVNNPNNSMTQSSRKYRLTTLDTQLKLKELPAGSYTLSVTVNAAGETRTVLTQSFTS